MCNAGRGSVLTTARKIEMDAVIMRGEDLSTGAVACVSNVKNPISLARAVMDKTPHVLMVGPGAEQFAVDSGCVELATQEYLVTPRAEQSLDRFMRLAAEKAASEATMHAATMKHIGVVSSSPSTSSSSSSTATDGADSSLPSSSSPPSVPSPASSVSSPASTTPSPDAQQTRLYKLAVLGDFDESFQVKADGSTNGAANSNSNDKNAASASPQAVTFGDDYEAGHDTVGAVAMDVTGRIAAGTSTGGITGKRPGRVGDAPIVASGVYADDEAAGVSSTGHGESIIKVALAKRVVDALTPSYFEDLSSATASAGESKSSSSSSSSSCPPATTPTQACERALSYMQRRVNGSGGLIAIDRWGRIGKSWSTPMMSWASVDAKGVLTAGIHTHEPVVERKLT